jgi:alanine dehydrogenase
MKTQKQERENAAIPQELLKEMGSPRHPLTIGVPKENLKVERRLAFTPEAVDMIVDAGHRVVLEQGAGAGVNYSDAAYAGAGANISSREQAFDCDLVFKIAPPTIEDIAYMKKKTTVCSMLQMPDISTEAIQAMAEKAISAVGYELMSPDGLTFPVRNSISEIEGAASVSVASELLSNDKGGKGILMGGVAGVSPVEVVIIGAGVAGTVAARAALALGAVVKIFDSDVWKLRKLQNDLGNPVFTSVFQPNVLVNAFKSADVVIGAMRYINDPVRYIISGDAVKTMKKGALLIDLRVNQGGCFETTCFLPSNHPMIFEKYGVLHYCVPNLSSRVARTTSMALSNIFTPLIVRMGEVGGVAGITKIDMTFRSGLYMYSGKLVNAYVAKHFNLPANDIGLYLSVF